MHQVPLQVSSVLVNSCRLLESNKSMMDTEEECEHFQGLNTSSGLMAAFNSTRDLSRMSNCLIPPLASPSTNALGFVDRNMPFCHLNHGVNRRPREHLAVVQRSWPPEKFWVTVCPYEAIANKAALYAPCRSLFTRSPVSTRSRRGHDRTAKTH